MYLLRGCRAKRPPPSNKKESRVYKYFISITLNLFSKKKQITDYENTEVVNMGLPDPGR